MDPNTGPLLTIIWRNVRGPGEDYRRGMEGRWRMRIEINELKVGIHQIRGKI